jgi:hypothetical protein
LPPNRANVIVAIKRDIRRIFSPNAELIEGHQEGWFAREFQFCRISQLNSKSEVSNLVTKAGEASKKI